MTGDDELEDDFVAQLPHAATHIMGRVTYRNMAAHWPTSTELVAQVMNDIPKVVFSKTLQTADWPESRIINGDAAKEIARLAAEPTARSSPTARLGLPALLAPERTWLHCLAGA